MNKLKCLIVDDEPIARQIIEKYIEQYPVLEIVGSCENAIEAKLLLKQNPVDVMFLDINMPKLSGISFLQTVNNPPLVIFTTAYKEYAFDAFELSACDYLMKPFSFERFIISVDKAIELIGLNLKNATSKEITINQRLDPVFIKSEGKIFNVDYMNIHFLEAYGNYTRIHMMDNLLIPMSTLSSFEEILPNYFLKIHRSFIVNKYKISHIEGNRIFISGKELPISSSYKDSFLKSCGL
ncbi:LytR/AlgR family response regulator transcription factor [Sphingobacterium endophyticum]|uniref:LytR/AlgR family response regulator transcription factor n=1 Tax=Sphingobacterium endophyticum TaxID=2546448 RepID=UPI0012E1A157|nr:LytTR family DNA-binding domain-containing protein [Sphingobacterium endophyticum]